MRRLGRRVDDQRDSATILAKELVDGRLVTDVAIQVAILSSEPLDERIAIPLGGGFFPEEGAAHVVVDPDDIEPQLAEELHRLRANQTRRPRDDNDRHAPSQHPQFTAQHTLAEPPMAQRATLVLASSRRWPSGCREPCGAHLRVLVWPLPLRLRDDEGLLTEETPHHRQHEI